MSARPHVDAKASKTSLWASACEAFGIAKKMQRFLLGFSLALWLSLSMTTITLADHSTSTIYVDASSPISEDQDGDRHYATLGAAIATLTVKDANTTIRIASGTYDIQTLSIKIPGLMLQSDQGPEKTVLLGSVALLAKNVLLQGLTIDARGQAVGVTIAGRRARVWQSVIRGADEVGVLFQSGDEAEVDSSEVRSNPIGVAIRHGSQARLTRSRILDNAATGVVVQRPAFGVTLSQNTISLNRGVGISVEGARASAFLQNEIRSNGIGVKLSGAQEAFFYQNTITANRGPGLFLSQSQGNELIRNQIEDNETAGIVIQDSSSNIIEANQITGHSRESAIELNSDSKANQIVRNLIEKNNFGIWFNPTPIEESERTPRANQIDSNTIRENQVGIKIEASDGANALRQNDISKNQTHGVHLIGVKNERIAKNKISENGQIGLYLEKSKHTVFSQNELLSNGAEGIKSIQSEDDFFDENIIAENALGVLLEEAKATEFSQNQIRENRSDGFKISGSNSLTLIQNQILSNKNLGLVLEDSQNVDFIQNQLSENQAGGVLIKDTQTVDLEENNFLSNASFGLKAEESAKDIFARRNFWGSASGPSNLVSATQSGSDKAEGFPLEFTFPWLPTSSEELVKGSTQGTIWTSETGGVLLEAERAGLNLQLSALAAGSSGTLILARRVHAPKSAPRLEKSFGFWAVQLSTQTSSQSAQVEVSFSEITVSDPADTASLQLFVLSEKTENAWKALDSQVLLEQKKVIASVSMELLQNATLALANVSGSASTMQQEQSAPKNLDSAPSEAKQDPEQDKHQDEDDHHNETPKTEEKNKEEKKAQEAPSLQPVLPEIEIAKSSQTPIAVSYASFNPYRLNTENSQIKNSRKGVIERITQIIQAVLRLEFATAWRGVVTLLQTEQPKQSGGLAGGSQRALRK
jgi:parallel beta-helix repeat protein